METTKKILMIEDDPTSVHLISRLLEKAGYQVDIACNGQEGLTKFREGSPDIVLCDIVLPRMDGFSLCRKLRQVRTDVPIVIISSNERVESAYVDLGASSFMAKPINEQKLLAEISKFLISKPSCGIENQNPESEEENQKAGSRVENQNASSEEGFQEGEQDIVSPDVLAVTPDSQPSMVGDPHQAKVEAFLSSLAEKKWAVGEGKKLLIIDDDKSTKHLLKRIFERFGFAVVEVSDGREGLDFLSKEKCDLILSDVVMDGMDGFSFFKELKKSEDFAKIPFVILTARKKMEEVFLELGVDDFLTKPFDPKELMARVSLKAGCPLPKELSESDEQDAPAPVISPESLSTQEKPVEPKGPVAPLAEPEQSQPKPSAREDQKGPGARVIVCGKEEKIVGEIVEKLKKRGCLVESEKDEQQILTRDGILEYSLILLQIYFNEEFPLDKTLEIISKFIKKKVRAIEAQIKDKTDMPDIKIPAIVLYKVPEEVTALSSSGENLAAVEDLLSRCQEQGVDKYIGMYSPITFDSKIKEFVNK